MTTKLTLLGLVMAAAVVLAACRAKDATDSTASYDSPEAVHQAWCDAIQAKDWKKMAGCWTPESRDMMARDLAATAGMRLFDVPRSAVQELFKRHGLDDAEIERKGPKAFDDADKVAFIAEMLALLEKTDNADAGPLGIAGSTLADLKVEEGKATGVLVTTEDGKEYRQQIEFHQINGSWLMHLISDAVLVRDQGEQDSSTIKGYETLVTDVAFSPDGRRLVSVGWDKLATVWDTLTWKPVLRIQGHKERIGAVAFSPEGNRLATGCWDDIVRLFDAHTGQQLRSLEGHTHTIDDVAFSADGRRLASVDRRGKVILWNAETGRELFNRQGSTWVAFSHDGQRLAVCDTYNVLKVWDVSTGNECFTITNHS